ncbi:hypothetical protein IT568_10660 [bacterium]|nr:hypothetical protein [bacterium]
MKIVSLLVALTLVVGCAEKKEETQVQKPVETTNENQKANAVGGLNWEIPSKWEVDFSKPMRIATYKIDSETECGVFYFGEGQGGNIQSNIDRWIGQFSETDRTQPETNSFEVSGVKVTVLSMSGTFVPGMMSSGNPKPGYALLGAIVESEKAPVFFKLTGPENVVSGAKTDFMALLNSIKK